MTTSKIYQIPRFGFFSAEQHFLEHKSESLESDTTIGVASSSEQVFLEKNRILWNEECFHNSSTKGHHKKERRHSIFANLMRFKCHRRF